MIIGVQGIQGSGKSTLCKKLKEKFNWEVISIDDFYLTRSELDTLFRVTKEEAWKVRGNPGTHDIDLLLNVLENYKNGEAVEVPIYDKCASVSGDRIGWRKLEQCSVLVLEGWCIGFEPIYDNTAVDNKLVKYNNINNLLDGLIILKPPCLDIVYKWREESEKEHRKKNKGMTIDETRDFINVYMPTYRKYLEKLYNSFIACPAIYVDLDEHRSVKKIFKKYS